jgi:hypothetical protein
MLPMLSYLFVKAKRAKKIGVQGLGWAGKMLVEAHRI